MTEVETLRAQLDDAMRDINKNERTLERYEVVLDSIAQLVWPDCTDVQADAPEYLTKLVTKVGVLARVTANDAQAWDVLRKHVRANHALSKLVANLREDARHAEREREELGERVVNLEGLIGIRPTKRCSLPPEVAEQMP